MQIVVIFDSATGEKVCSGQLVKKLEYSDTPTINFYLKKLSFSDELVTRDGFFIPPK